MKKPARPVPRELDLALKDRALLRRLRDALGVTDPPEIDVAELAEIEGYVHSVVPDPVLALLVARGKLLDIVAAETNYYGDTGAAWEPPIPAAERRLVCFDHWGDHPQFSVGFSPTDDRSTVKLVVWDLSHWAAFPELGVDSVSAFVRKQILPWPDEDGNPPPVVDLRAPPGPADAAFVPRLVVQAPPEPRLVEHPKFGRGRVLAQREDRLEIAFESGERRTLLASFVREVGSG
jgi:hypothetical protein